MNAEKLSKMAGTVRTGGKGTVRRQVDMCGRSTKIVVINSSSSGCERNYLARSQGYYENTETARYQIHTVGGGDQTLISIIKFFSVCCRKKKAVHKTSSTDEKKLQNNLKRLGVNPIPGIEEVLLFSDDGTALCFTNPKVQASIAANTYVVSGPSVTKQVQQDMGGAGGFSSASLQQLMAQMGLQGMPNMGGAEGAGVDDEDDDDDDDDVPDLVGNFDQAE